MKKDFLDNLAFISFVIETWSQEVIAAAFCTTATTAMTATTSTTTTSQKSEMDNNKIIEHTF